MSPVTLILIYAFCWWLTLFCVLPIGVVSQEEAEAKGNTDDFVEGSAPSAPVKPNLKKKFLWTSLIAAVLTFAYWLVVTLELVKFEPLA